MTNSRSSRIVPHIIILLGVFATALPLIVVLVDAFKLPRDIVSGSFAFTPTLYNFKDIFQNYSFLQLTLNSLIAACGATLLISFITALAAFSLTQFRWPPLLVNSVMIILLIIQMVPPIVFAGPFYLISRYLRIYDTPLALIMAYLVIQLPLSLLIMRRFFEEIPKEIIEAAAIDGARKSTVFFRIALPVGKLGISTAALLTFVFSWNDFMFALSLTTTPKGMTIPMGIANFSQDFRVLYGNICAASAFAALPALVITIFAQKYITRGLTLGAVKG